MCAFHLGSGRPVASFCSTSGKFCGGALEIPQKVFSYMLFVKEIHLFTIMPSDSVLLALRVDVASQLCKPSSAMGFNQSYNYTSTFGKIPLFGEIHQAVRSTRRSPVHVSPPPPEPATPARVPLHGSSREPFWTHGSGRCTLALCWAAEENDPGSMLVLWTLAHLLVAHPMQHWWLPSRILLLVKILY